MRRNLLVCILSLAPVWAFGQVTQADYERAAKLREKYQGLAVNVPEKANAIENTRRFWYRKSVKGGNEFVVVDAETLAKRAAFDHAKLASSLSVGTGQTFTALTLPFSTFTFIDNETAIEFVMGGSTWRCDLSGYSCAKRASPQRGQGTRPPAADSDDDLLEFTNDVVDGMVDLPPQSQQPPQGLQVPGEDRPRGNQEPRVSPDGAWEALVLNYNVYVRPKGKTSPADSVALSFDGSEGNYYTLASIAWSPDSNRIAAYRVRPGYLRASAKQRLERRSLFPQREHGNIESRQGSKTAL